MRKKTFYSSAFLKARIKHDAMSMSSFAATIGVSPETLRRKIGRKQYFNIGEIYSMIEALNVVTASECTLLFFLSKENESKTHYNLYKAILDNDIPPIKIALTLGVPLETLFDKIMGAKDFRWNEVIAIKENFFPNYTMNSLFERGVTA